MRFDCPINRPPIESESFFLQTTKGCSHAACAFCASYKEVPFQASPIEEIEEDLIATSKIPYMDPPRRIFLQGANTLVRPYDELMQIAELIHEYMPYIQSIGGWARIDDICDKSLEQMKALKDTGYSSFYFGIETGDDDLLKSMNKGYDAALALEQGLKLKESGFAWASTYVAGLGGKDYGDKHAVASAELFNKVEPHMILGHSLIVLPGTALWDRVQSGDFVEMGEGERMEEMIAFIEALDIPTILHADNISFPFGVTALLPEHKAKTIEGYRRVIDEAGAEHKMRAHREWAMTAMMPQYAQMSPLSKRIF